ncbi:fumarylacetoacetate hydrolase family protein [Clostridium estertheticum]|uniref:fumarylacetoacetate hydrolase family protein n=1 Tax=Clostridium estertheticum TaxID=238834 RepID=UPI001C7CFD55|nr:fumarylacetoacetate hydrolase family protein [Clostridium estertheticum]MBX4262058.1 fumarylacetoacetate hydrolase family protein [Clostridium estertheticum]WLC68988.1 fumarylacetoacetate hydrolase family protein [Clostridium estertheticum]
MKLKKIKIKNQENYTLCLLSEDQWISFQAVLDTVPDDGTKERAELEKASDDLITFLKNREFLEPKLNELIESAKNVTTDLLIAGKDVIPYRPLMYRDFMLCEAHIINSGRGFVKYTMPKVLPFVKVYETLFSKPFPSFLPKKSWYDNPVYYKGNVMSFIGDGETVTYPRYATLKDYELELGMIITKDIVNATEEEGLSAIGAFCVFNDFSARNVQFDEMKKTGFGPCKAKDFASAISTVVVTADEVLPVIDSLKTRVIINDKIVAEGQLDSFYHSLGKAVAYASKGESVYAGEFMGTGTIPNCCGMENDTLLECGDVIRIEIDKIGSLTNPINTKLL